MSRIGNKPVSLPGGVTASVDGQEVKVKGPKGEVSHVLVDQIIAKMGGSLGREAYNTGNCESSPIACGQIAGLIDDVKPVKKVVEDMIAEAEAVLSRVNGFVQ